MGHRSDGRIITRSIQFMDNKLRLTSLIELNTTSQTHHNLAKTGSMQEEHHPQLGGKNLELTLSSWRTLWFCSARVATQPRC